MSSLVAVRNLFCENEYPRFVIKDAMDRLLEHGIRMPVAETIPFEINAIRHAVRSLTTHRTKGRLVIDFGLDQS